MTFTRIATTREEAHEAITAAYGAAKALLQDGRRVRVVVVQDYDPMTTRQRRFLHGPVMKQISEQASVDGARYTRKVWKEYMREQLLGTRWITAEDGTPLEVRVSSEHLNVKDYSDYIDRVIAHAVTDWGVAFELDPREREAVRYREPTQHKEEATC